MDNQGAKKDVFTSRIKILFIPVSSSSGVGEYARSLGIAQSLTSHFKQAVDIHFILNRQAGYAAHCPFSSTLLEKSPTKDSVNVCRVLTSYRPDVVVFDCSGRAKQMRAAKALGARVIFISQHQKKRASGLKFNRNGVVDHHWVVQHNYCITPLSKLEQFKIKHFKFAEPVNVGPFVRMPSHIQQAQVCRKFRLSPHQYIIVNAGSGGHFWGGKLCADLFYEAITRVAAQSSLKIIVVFGVNYPHALPVPYNEQIIVYRSLASDDFVSLLKNAKIAMLSGGDGLLQAIALKVPTVAAPVSKDQPLRLKHCAKQGVAIKVSLKPKAMANAILRLLNNKSAMNELKQSLASVETTGAESFIVASFSEFLQVSENE